MLRTNQTKALEALLNGATKQQAAMAAGVQPATLSRWLQEDAFRATLTAHSDQAIKDAAVRLKATLDLAVTVMRETMTDESIHAAVRLRAADMAAAHALKLLETADLIERIEQLEERLNEHQDTSSKN